MDAETAALMVEHGAFLVPTLATHDAMSRRGADVGLTPVGLENRDFLHAGAKVIELDRAAGVAVGFGSDLMGALEDEQLAGLRLQVEVDGVLERCGRPRRSTPTCSAAPTSAASGWVPPPTCWSSTETR
jgi:hypothetical protein